MHTTWHCGIDQPLQDSASRCRSCSYRSRPNSGTPTWLTSFSQARNATVTLTHTGTKDLLAHTKRSDIVIAAIGSAHFLKANAIKQGAVVIDVGISRTSTGLLGDVDPDVMEVASFFAPMPGGVGPMTRAMLLQNVVEACER